MARFGEQQSTVFTIQQLGMTLFREPAGAATLRGLRAPAQRRKHPKSLGNQTVDCFLEEAPADKSLSTAPPRSASPLPMAHVLSLQATGVVQWATS